MLDVNACSFDPVFEKAAAKWDVSQPECTLNKTDAGTWTHNPTQSIRNYTDGILPNDKLSESSGTELVAQQSSCLCHDISSWISAWGLYPESFHLCSGNFVTFKTLPCKQQTSAGKAVPGSNWNHTYHPIILRYVYTPVQQTCLHTDPLWAPERKREIHWVHKVTVL